MAKYFIQRKMDTEGSTVYEYTAPGHYDCKTTRLHDKTGGGVAKSVTNTGDTVCLMQVCLLPPDPPKA